MAFEQSGRQTVLPEWSNPNETATDLPSLFPYAKSTSIIGAPGTATHLVHESDADATAGAGTTYCGRWECRCEPITTELQALNVARSICQLCVNRLQTHEIETLALMANACSQQVITAADITNETIDNE